MSDWLLILLIQLNFLILLSISFNLTAGYLGYINMATVSIYGVGAYITAILTTQYGWNFFSTLPLSILGGVCLGSIIALPSFRVRSIYYLIVSIGFQLLLHDIFKNSTLTGDKEGIKDILFPSFLGINISSPLQFCLLSTLILILVLLFVWRMTVSPFGRLMRGVRENEMLILTLGKDVNRIKLITFACSGAISSLAGSLYATYSRFVSYEAFGLEISITLLVVVTIGGIGQFWGPVLGSFFVMIVPEMLRYLPNINDTQIAIIQRIFYGGLLLVLLRYSPSGIVDGSKKLSAFISRIFFLIVRNNR